MDNKRSFVYDMRCRLSLDADMVETSAPSVFQEQSPWLEVTGAKQCSTVIHTRCTPSC